MEGATEFEAKTLWHQKTLEKTGGPEPVVSAVQTAVVWAGPDRRASVLAVMARDPLFEHNQLFM
jgi:hypothetical protein